MNVDKAPANSRFSTNLGSGDIGRGRAKHRSILQMSFTYHKCKM